MKYGRAGKVGRKGGGGEPPALWMAQGPDPGMGKFK